MNALLSTILPKLYATWEIGPRILGSRQSKNQGHEIIVRGDILDEISIDGCDGWWAIEFAFSSILILIQISWHSTPPAENKNHFTYILSQWVSLLKMMIETSSEKRYSLRHVSIIDSIIAHNNRFNRTCCEFWYVRTSEKNSKTVMKFWAKFSTMMSS